MPAVKKSSKKVKFIIVRFNKFHEDAYSIVDKIRNNPMIKLTYGKDRRERIFVHVEDKVVATVLERQVRKLKTYVPCTLWIENANQLSPEGYIQSENRLRERRSLELYGTILNAE